MSKTVKNFVNNIVDDEDSEFYLINKKKRHFWHSKSTTITCKVRRKNEFNHSPEIANNIRAFLLGEDQYFFKTFSETSKLLWEEDKKKLEKSIIARVQTLDNTMEEDEIRKNIGLYIRELESKEIREMLELDINVSCRMIGYEKELFYLKCYTKGLLPVRVMRVLYHTQYNNHHFEKDHIDFEDLLEKIEFI